MKMILTSKNNHNMKSSIILTLALAFVSINLQAQDQLIASTDDLSVILDDAKATQGESTLTMWKAMEQSIVAQLQADVQYPQVAQDNFVEGTVLILLSFDGEVHDARVIRSLPGGCDQAALQALKNLPVYYRQLGGLGGKAFNMTIPFHFRMK